MISQDFPREVQCKFLKNFICQSLKTVYKKGFLQKNIIRNYYFYFENSLKFAWYFFWNLEFEIHQEFLW